MSNDDLERSLGLSATIAISMGSMIGSGIFILPGVAFLEVENASVVLAFLVGGILTVPAALSAAELATAIPESGGSYTYIQRGMGPVVGTVAGVGNWMVLNFKTALALIGGLPYLVYLFPSIGDLGGGLLDPVVVLAVVLTIGFTVLNALTSDGAGQAQNLIVVVMMIALGLMILVSLPDVANSGAEANGLTDIGGGFLAATSLVFVAYAGVIKVTSVAEEIQEPDRNIPLGIMISLAVTTVVYVAITYIAVVTVDINEQVNNIPVEEGGLASDGEGAILAIAADNIVGTVGAVIIVIAALLALASTANSGVLSASRYPFAMARDGLANAEFGQVNPRTGTPVVSVLATGGAVVFMVVALPVDEVASFGAAFQIIVFMLVSGSVIGFREADPDGYEPSYLSPGYPYLHLFGVVSGVALLTQLSGLAFIGTIVIVALSVVYYYAYARLQRRSEGTVKSELRDELVEASENQTHSLLNREGEYHVLVALWNADDADRDSDRDALIDIVSTLDSHGLDVRIDVVEFEQARRETLRENHPDINADSPSWVEMHDNVSYRKVTARDVPESIVEYATYNDIQVVAHAFAPDAGPVGFIDDDLQWVVENTPCDSVILDGDSPETVEKVTILSEGPTYVPTKVLVADALAVSHTAHLEIVHVVEEDTPEERRRAESYLGAIREDLLAPTTTRVVEANDPAAEAAQLSRDADILLTELDITTVLRRFRPTPMVAVGLDGDISTLFVYSDNLLTYQTLWKRILMRYVFRGLR